MYDHTEAAVFWHGSAAGLFFPAHRGLHAGLPASLLVQDLLGNFTIRWGLLIVKLCQRISGFW